LRKINKRAGFEPQSLTDWVQKNPQGKYTDLTYVEREDIRSECLQEQYYLCAYCCKSISGNNHDCMNEHVEARGIAPQRSLEFTNIVASCTTPKQCDDSHGSHPLPLTPFMAGCETELDFTLSGKVRGLTPDALETIRVLNLGDDRKNNKSLIEQRKQFIHAMMFANGIDSSDGLDDDELIKMIINDISTPAGGKLEAFVPVVVNVLRQWVA
jgi:uncharacterized protein (TIGR02646 family)